MDGGAWWAAVHGVARSRTRLTDFTFTFHFHALGKEMATHSSVLAWSGSHSFVVGLWICLFWIFHKDGIIQCVTVYVWLLSLDGRLI